MEVVTLTEAFVKYLQEENVGTFGTNLFLGVVPSTAPDNVYWVQIAGGSPVQRLRTGESVKQYNITVNYRSTSTKDVERKMFELEEKLNCANCIALEGFVVLTVEARQFPSSIDLDNEERRVSFLQATIQVYKSC